MYACFRHVPKKVRQEAFDFLVKNDYGKVLPTSCAIGVLTQIPITAYVPCCPLGAINAVLGLDQVVVGRSVELKQSCIFMPANGEMEVSLLALCHPPIRINNRDAQRFINHNDARYFNTLAKLARAMGAKCDSLEDS